MAKEWDNVIRINLDFLQNPEEAVRIVQETQSVEGAKMVAKYVFVFREVKEAINFKECVKIVKVNVNWCNNL